MYLLLEEKDMKLQQGCIWLMLSFLCIIICKDLIPV